MDRFVHKYLDEDFGVDAGYGDDGHYVETGSVPNYYVDGNQHLLGSDNTEFMVLATGIPILVMVCLCVAVIGLLGLVVGYGIGYHSRRKTVESGQYLYRRVRKMDVNDQNSEV